MSVIYEPSGRAGEYSELAANLYKGCGHGCEYCYAPLVLKTTPEQHNKPEPRKDILRALESDAIKLKKAGDKKSILLSFTTDPYNPIEPEQCITRRALEILFRNGLNVSILTKGGARSVRDFDLLAANKDKVKYGATLVFAKDAEAQQREPGAAPTSERITCLKAAHDLGIKTWVSLEPVYYTKDAYALIEATKDFVDIFKVGKLNYREEAKSINWRDFAINVELMLKGTGKEYLLKQDLRRYL